MVPASAEAHADALIDELDATHDPLAPELADRVPPVEAPFASARPTPLWNESTEFASRWRRLTGSTVDVLAIGTAASTLAFALGHRWITPLLFAFYVIAATATTGRTFGKLVVGTRVIDDASGRTPSWSQSILRYGVPSLGAVALLALGPGLLVSALSVGWTVLVYGPVLYSERRQGLHDVVARTVVLRTR